MGNKEQKAKNWSLSVGWYPGILFGIRTYDEPNQTTDVLYMPMIDIALEIFKK